MVKVLIKKINPSAQMPSYKTEGASGMDLMAYIEKPINLEPVLNLLVFLYKPSNPFQMHLQFYKKAFEQRDLFFLLKP